MKDLMGMMKKAQEFQQRAQEMQAEAAAHVVEGTAGAGMVTVTMTAKGDLQGVKFDPSLLKPEEAEILEDLIVAAHADARRKGEEFLQKKMGEMTEGLPIPPGMKFPF
ncbi:YbaB/EbfC family nucleoid-associated protein [Pelagibacterium flavum]|uniref:Nucleoid-associated protein OF122_17560 n=1 Tax=Pelagibacterium flavum TaxID=2984530 RepID=A0ABY6IML3_9HYPH|nr:YbaB/EbfC family nucleoid-associated protein [Pelagibacterium sp. YIM 151497]UYQ71826.1 YbaB/EbfC family nucleoid-associated protein [Pelagibacterium sp. YIM 151497]|tara:strand:+ start:2983 stop:3306 length:324 start_codon:yes stop_codon:yes gene_type:complete